jgi:hypothetical protein
MDYRQEGREACIYGIVKLHIQNASPHHMRLRTYMEIRDNTSELKGDIFVSGENSILMSTFRG